MKRIASKATPLLALLLVVASTFTGFSQSLPLTITNAAQAKVEGEALVKELLLQKPVAGFVQTGTLTNLIRNRKVSEFSIRFETVVTPANWAVTYDATGSSNRFRLGATHGDGKPTEFQLDGRTADPMTPFAASEFWVADLGLEFFHWPEQRLIKKEMRRGRSCRVLESVNPQPTTNSYSRVVSWIDRETQGIVFAEAYDAKGRLLKEFSPKEFKRVNGQWLLQEMEIRNVQTGSRSRIEFDLAKEQ